ncbi:MAG: WD40 repeat domain-containing protein [Oscillospiraceae bacterium]|nr:WD40 repeat domain-containing protein [Oscillospiraceae bacterium]
MWAKKNNVTPLRKNPRLWKRILIAALCLVVVTAVLCVAFFYEELNVDAAVRWFRYLSVQDDENYGVASFDAHASNRFAPFGDGFAVASIAGLETFHADGSPAGTYAVSLEYPIAQAGKNAVLCYDVSGKSLVLVKKGEGQVLSLTSDNGFYDANLSTGDTLCIASSESGYKTVIRVYDDSQKEIYRWFSATQFMPVCAVSPSGDYLATIALGQKDGSFESTLYLFSTKEEEPLFTISLSGEMVYDMTFTAEKELSVLTEKSLRKFSIQGEELDAWEHHTAGLTDYTFRGDGFALLSVNMYDGESPVTVLSVKNGKVLGTLPVQGKLLGISACGRYTAVLTSDELIICRSDMSEYARTPNTWLATHVICRDDGTAIVLGGGASHIFLP